MLQNVNLLECLQQPLHVKLHIIRVHITHNK